MNFPENTNKGNIFRKNTNSFLQSGERNHIHKHSREIKTSYLQKIRLAREKLNSTLNQPENSSSPDSKKLIVPKLAAIYALVNLFFQPESCQFLSEFESAIYSLNGLATLQNFLPRLSNFLDELEKELQK